MTSNDPHKLVAARAHRTTLMGMPRTCTVCTHPDREEIDKALLDGGPYRVIAVRFGASASAVYRHKREHLPRALVRAVEAREAEHGANLLDQLQDLQRRALCILDQAEAAGDLRTALAAVREARGCVELLGKATGQLVEKHAHLHLEAPPSASVLAELSASFRSFVEAQKGQSCGAIEDHLYQGEEALPSGWVNE